jgi:hypothetical protein
MPTFNSTIYAKQILPTLANRMQSPIFTLNVRMVEVIYTMLGTEAAADIINIVKLPQGAIIDPTLSSIVTDGIAGTATIDIGDDDTAGVGAAADVDRYADGLDVAAAGVDLFTANSAAARLTPYALGADSIIRATLVTLVTPVATRKLTFRIAYRIEA